MNSGLFVGNSPVKHALVAVRATMAELITAAQDGGLDHHDESGLLELLEEFTILANQAQAFDAELIAACRDRGVPEVTCQRSMRQVLEQVCRVGSAEAGRRVRAAEAAGQRVTPTGLPLPRLRGRVADAMTAGMINSEQTEQICRTLTKIDNVDVHPDDVARVESDLVEQAEQLGPRELKQVCQRVLDIYDPDGPEPNEQRNWDRRSFRMHQTPSGAVVGEFRLTPSTGAKLAAILEPLAKPRRDRTAKDRTATTDQRSRDQRLHDALDDACSRLLRVGGLPDSGGTPATVIVTIDLNDLLAHTGAGTRGVNPVATTTAPERADGTEPETEAAPEPVCPAGARFDPGPPGRVRRRRPRHGTTSGGVSLTVPELLKLATEAEIYPVVLNQHGILLDLGRSRRIANKHQTIALIARDGGCSFPGCDFPPEWCERHHVVPWEEGGPTKLCNLTLLCAYHHHNFLNRGWQVHINADGLPEWIPPRWIDPEQAPRLNNRIIARIHQSTLLTDVTPLPVPPDPGVPPPEPE
ncbi:HNH endonuclease signature motif containing protein [Microlunatus speluncae]|uniref:HNH endonuclease signature motif containing protein n=1 Tax=Microlunatus speluncae TaxID=2594267 RepID=UPI00126617B4|nr:HNH endonuclease signature motif containing protein [Microlunatus speluncae]